MQQLVIMVVIIALLSGCSSYNNAFECKLGKGVNCTSVSKINSMVDSGAFNDSEKHASNNKIKKETIKVANKTPFPMVLPSDFHNSIVQRMPETTLRIWVAPYVSAQDGYIDVSNNRKLIPSNN
jgi:type IV conjugative transfer system lipoprotein TraV